MKFGFALLAGLLVAQTVSTGLDISTSGCRVEKVDNRDAFSCPCVGGSGNYDWHFSDIPDGWQAKGDRIYAPSGRFPANKIYGLRVQVFDKQRQDSIQKSLFFSFQNGNVKQVADHDFNFDVNGLLQGNKSSSKNTLNVQKVFDGVDGIGGGSGLPKLVTYFTGRGFYNGDNNNPYITLLPSDAEFDKILLTGNIDDVRNFFVNAGKNKGSCKEIDDLLNRSLFKLRTRIGKSKDEVDGIKNLITTLEGQIKNLQAQLQKSIGQDTQTAALTAQIQQLKTDKTKAELDLSSQQTALQQTINQVNTLEETLSAAVQENKKLVRKSQQRKVDIANIDSQIARLQEQINKLNANKNDIIASAQADETALVESNKKIADLKVQIQTLHTTITDIRSKIKTIVNLINTTIAKINDLQKELQFTNSQQRTESIKKSLDEFQRRLDQAKAKLAKAQPDYDNFRKSYDDFTKIEQDTYNKCFKTLFNDNKIDFQQDLNGYIQFANQDYFENYIQKLFGTAFRGTSSIQTGGGIQYLSQGGIKVKRVNIFSPNWIRSNGNPRDDDYGLSAGQTFTQNDFDCSTISQPSSYRGRVISINKNVAHVVNDKNERCQVYLGGCTLIEAVNKQLPEVGDEIFWRGTLKQGKTNQYNAKHVLCK